MVELLGETKVPGAVALFGEYGSIFGEPALAFALDLKLILKAKHTDLDFFIVDGYKLDSQKHVYFEIALKQLWTGGVLEFKTMSQIPIITGLGTNSALAVALSGLLINLKKVIAKKKKRKSINESDRIISQYKTIKQISNSAFQIENAINAPVSPLQTTTSAIGGAVLLDSEKKESIFSISCQDQKWYAHKLNNLENISFVIGYPKNRLTNLQENPRPLFDSPPKPKSVKRTKLHTLRTTLRQSGTQESILNKLTRFVSRSNFAMDNIKEMGKITREACTRLIQGDIEKVGKLLAEQYNLLTILGVCPDELKPFVEATKDDSYGVTITGVNGDTILAISDAPQKVVENIKKLGGEGFIGNILNRGFEVKI